jgi:hypothetical protein
VLLDRREEKRGYSLALGRSGHLLFPASCSALKVYISKLKLRIKTSEFQKLLLILDVVTSHTKHVMLFPEFWKSNSAF